MHITYISKAIEISRQTAKINRPKLGKCSQTHNTTIFGVSIFRFLWISVCIYFNIKHTLTTIMHVTSTSETLKISRQTCNKNGRRWPCCCYSLRFGVLTHLWERVLRPQKSPGPWRQSQPGPCLSRHHLSRESLLPRVDPEHQGLQLEILHNKHNRHKYESVEHTTCAFSHRSSPLSRFSAAKSLSGTTRVSRYQKGKTSLDLNEARDDEVLGCSGISWIICKSAPHSRQITSTRRSVFLQAVCRPTISIKALKAVLLCY